jgi:hypothetical protein
MANIFTKGVWVFGIPGLDAEIMLVLFHRSRRIRGFKTNSLENPAYILSDIANRCHGHLRRQS